MQTDIVLAGVGVFGSIAAAVLVVFILFGVAGWALDLKAKRRARIERELDRKAAQLRRTVFDLAAALADDKLSADATQRALARQAYISRGVKPKPTSGSGS